jgi:hypothetical protein
MTFYQKCKVWMGGYQPAHVTHESLESLEPIMKLGGLILFSTLFAGAMWGIAGWSLTTGSSETRALIAASAALLGGSMVLVIDRSFLYFTDTSDGGFWGHLGYGVFRVLVILAVGSMTSQAIMPRFLGSELKAHALGMVEHSEGERARDLSQRFDLAGKRTSAEAAANEVETFRQAMNTLPQDIAAKVQRANDCRAEYNHLKRALGPHPTQDERNRLAAKRANCRVQAESADGERRGYLTQARSQFDGAVAHRQALQDEFAKASASLDQKVGNARRIEEAAVTEASASVLWDLIRHDRGALIKYATYSFLVLVLELLPMIQKGFAGRTAPGMLRAANRAVSRMRAATRIESERYEAKASAAINAMSVQAVEQLMNTPAMQDEFTRALAGYLSAKAPIEAVETLMRDIERRQVSQADFLMRHPQYASFISEAWSSAVKEAVKSITRRFCADTPH